MAIAVIPACTLLTTTEGLTGGAPDAASSERNAPTIADASDATASNDAVPCACPPGSAPANGACAVGATSPNRTCLVPLEPLPCQTAFDVTLCASDPKFPYDPKCGGNARQTAFFALGALAPGKKWLLAAAGIEVLARTDINCDGGVPTCGSLTSVSAELATQGTTVAVGKLISQGCKTLRIDIGPVDAGPG